MVDVDAVAEPDDGPLAAVKRLGADQDRGSDDEHHDVHGVGPQRFQMVEDLPGSLPQQRVDQNADEDERARNHEEGDLLSAESSSGLVRLENLLHPELQQVHAEVGEAADDEAGAGLGDPAAKRVVDSQVPHLPERAKL